MLSISKCTIDILFIEAREKVYNIYLSDDRFGKLILKLNDTFLHAAEVQPECLHCFGLFWLPYGTVDSSTVNRQLVERRTGRTAVCGRTACSESCHEICRATGQRF